MSTNPKPLAQIIKDLSKPIPKEWLQNKKKGGSNITFCPWYRVAYLMDTFAPGWQKEIRNTIITGTHIIHTVRVYVTAAEGTFYREATGIEPLEVKGYGDPSSNAESMAFRRACANWGLGAHLYEKDDVSLDHNEPEPKQQRSGSRRASGDGAPGRPPETWAQKIKAAKDYLNSAADTTEQKWRIVLGQIDNKLATWPEPHAKEVREHLDKIRIKRGLVLPHHEPAGADVGDGDNGPWN